jgi:hypothetical protein
MKARIYIPCISVFICLNVYPAIGQNLPGCANESIKESVIQIVKDHPPKKFLSEASANWITLHTPRTDGEDIECSKERFAQEFWNKVYNKWGNSLPRPIQYTGWGYCDSCDKIAMLTSHQDPGFPGFNQARSECLALCDQVRGTQDACQRQVNEKNQKTFEQFNQALSQAQRDASYSVYNIRMSNKNGETGATTCEGTLSVSLSPTSSAEKPITYRIEKLLDKPGQTYVSVEGIE